MTLFAALRKNKPIRLKNRAFIIRSAYNENLISRIYPKTWLDPEWFLSTIHLSKEDLLSKNWEIKIK